MSSPAGEQRRRNKHAEGHENEERWLLPYADMITLLLALFIMLYAASSVNNAKLEKLSQSINAAFNGKKQTPGENQSEKTSKVPKEAPGDKLLQAGVTLQELQKAAKAVEDRKAEDERLRALKQRIDRAAKEQGFSKSVSTTINERGLVVRLVSDKVLFDTGNATIRSGIKPLILDIAGVLRAEPNNVRVEGHTDSVPIKTPQFPSNWELSAGRSTSVVRLLIRDGMNAEKLAAAGYGSQRPRASNGSEAGKQKNRRVEIVVLRRSGLQADQG